MKEIVSFSHELFNCLGVFLVFILFSFFSMIALLSSHRGTVVKCVLEMTGGFKFRLGLHK